jgi:Holliday junction DNA helicase RuvA
MIAHINGRLVEKSPTSVVIECNGVGYFLKISLNTFSAIGPEENLKLLTQFVVREDAQLLYGFISEEEREMFNHLVSVSGIGPNIAMIMLSSLLPSEIGHAITSEDVATIQGVKGIGAKTAQRVIVDLKDKMLKMTFGEDNSPLAHNTTRTDALTALVSLGFDKKQADKALDKVGSAVDSVELMIKGALKIL